MADALSDMESNNLHLVLELVLLRLPSPACLVNAAAACKQWRRVIADSGFLRLWRSLHTPAAAAVAGYYFNHVRCMGPDRGIRQSFVPSPPPATTPDTTIHARHFSLDFLPDFPDADRPFWRILDSRGSLLLIRDVGHRNFGFPDTLLVCNPLARCYKRIPPPPDPILSGSWSQPHEFYLVDGEADDGVGRRVGMSNFRVLCEVHSNAGVTRNAMFATGGAAAGVDDDGSWTSKAMQTVAPRLDRKRHFGHAGGRWYYLALDDRTLISIDGRTGEYSSFVLPTTEDWPDHLWNNEVYITDGRDGKPRIFSAVDGIFKVFARLDTGGNGNDDGDGEWALEKKIVLQEATRGLPGYKPSFFDQLLSIQTWVPGSSVTFSALAQERWPFSVDLETMEVKPVAASNMGKRMYQYQLPWPPVLKACLD